MGDEPAPPGIRARRKSAAATLLLAALLGFTAVCGVGHIYLGRARRGIIILAAAFVIAGVGGAVVAAALPESPDPDETLADLAASLLVMVALVVVYVGFVIWTAYDAWRLCKTYNAAIDDTGRAPW